MHPPSPAGPPLRIWDINTTNHVKYVTILHVITINYAKDLSWGFPLPLNLTRPTDLPLEGRQDDQGRNCGHQATRFE